MVLLQSLQTADGGHLVKDSRTNTVDSRLYCMVLLRSLQTADGGHLVADLRTKSLYCLVLLASLQTAMMEAI